jgi:hypothetical protein
MASADDTSPPSADEAPSGETWALALGALSAALMTLAVDHHGPVTVLMLTAALIPWALLAGGVRLPTWLFVVWTLLPAAQIVAAEKAGGPIFLGVLVACHVFSVAGSWTTRVATRGTRGRCTSPPASASVR